MGRWADGLAWGGQRGGRDASSARASIRPAKQIGQLASYGVYGDISSHRQLHGTHSRYFSVGDHDGNSSRGHALPRSLDTVCFMLSLSMASVIHSFNMPLLMTFVDAMQCTIVYGKDITSSRVQTYRLPDSH